MKFERFVVGMGETNSYIIYDENILEAIIIDPGDEAKRLMKYIDKRFLKIQGIILTHYHYDHTGAVEALKEKYQCPIYAHKKDIEGLKNPEINHSKSSHKKPISIDVDKTLSHGDTINIGNIILEVIHTPGHTPGGICLRVKDTSLIFRNKIYSISDPSILGKDIEPKAEVQEAYRLYESANGAATYSDFKYLLQNHGCSKGSNIKINDHTIIHNTIISDLSFNKTTYDMTNGQVSQTGVSYIEKVEGNKIFFI